MLIFSCLSLSFTTFFLVLMIEPRGGCPVEKYYVTEKYPALYFYGNTYRRQVCVCMHLCTRARVCVWGGSQCSINIYREVTQSQTSWLSSLCAYTDLQPYVLWNIKTMSELDCPSKEFYINVFLDTKIK